MKGVSVSVRVVVLCVVISHVQTSVHLSPDDQSHLVLMVIPPTDHRNQNNVTLGSKQRHRREATNPYGKKDISGFSMEEKKILIDKHNEYRRFEKSSDMTYMVWHEDLERFAQAWVETCEFKHSATDMRRNIGPFGYIGENLFAAGNYDPDFLTTAWHDEITVYTYGTSIYSHYTQMIWASSYALGCGVKYCPKGFFMVACHYGPGGNVNGAYPFKKGKACSECSRLENEVFCMGSMCSQFPVIGLKDEKGSGTMPRGAPAQLVIGYIIMSAILSFTVV